MIVYPIKMKRDSATATITEDTIIFKDDDYNPMREEPIRLANGSEEECIQGHINCLYTRGYKVVDECKTTVMKLFKYQSRFLWEE